MVRREPFNLSNLQETGQQDVEDVAVINYLHILHDFVEGHAFETSQADEMVDSMEQQILVVLQDVIFPKEVVWQEIVDHCLTKS